MLKPKPNALRVVEATPGKIKKVKKPVSKFIIHMVELWLGMNCQYVFSNMQRWGKMTQKIFRTFLVSSLTGGSNYALVLCTTNASCVGAWMLWYVQVLRTAFLGRVFKKRC